MKENEAQGAEKDVEKEAQGVEEVVELPKENDNRIEDSVSLNNEITGTVVNNVRSEDMENVESAGENSVGKNDNEDNCDAEMREEDALSEISDIGSQVMEDILFRRN